MFSKRFKAISFLLLGLGAALMAQQPVQFGGAVSLDAPLSNLRTDLNDKGGIGTSFQVSIGAGEHLSVRPRLDLEFFRVSRYHRLFSNYVQERTFYSAGTGADLLYAFDGNGGRGFYCLAGVGVLQWFQHSTRTEIWNHDEGDGNRSDTRDNRVSLWAALGLGYQLNRHLGFEARAVFSRYDGPPAGGLQANTGEVPTEGRKALILQFAVTGRW
jgi:hypothetical protein